MPGPAIPPQPPPETLGRSQDPILGSARRGVAAAVRELAEALVERDAPAGTLSAIAEEVGRLTETIRSSPERPPMELDLSALSFEPVAQGADIGGPTYCLFSGREHPAGIGARMWREGDSAVGEVTLSQLEGGPPGRAHGGVVTGLCDDLIRGLLMVCGIPAFTASLTVNLKAATPLGVPLRMAAQVDRREGRKVWASGHVTAAGLKVATCEALLIVFAATAP